MSIAEKLTTVAENVPKVYEAGQKSMVDESKIIEKTVNGLGFINIDDVSEVPHEVSVNLSSDTITDFSDVSLTACGKNLYNLEAAYSIGETKFTITDNVVTIPTGSSAYGISVAGNNGLISGNTYTFNFKITGSATERAFRLNYTDGTTKMIYLTNPTLTIPKDKQVKNVAFYVGWGSVIEQDIVISDIQIESGTVATSYESYKGKTYSPNADGTVNVKSISPTMNIFANETDINISAIYHKSYGMQTEYDRFWDNYQQNGAEISYNYAFAYTRWNDNNFKPKYNIVPTTANYMFQNSEIKQLKSILQAQNVILDTSKCTSLQSMFMSSKIEHIPAISCASSSTLSNVFSYCNYVKTIEKFILKEDGTNTFTNTFVGCSELEHIIFEGVIGSNGLNLQWSTKLSKDSITSLINALSSTKSGLTITLSKTAVNNAFGIDVDDESTWGEGTEYYNLRHSKDNWTFSYV